MQIIDGFTLNNAKPIDDRIVTSGTASRDAVAYKYNGLRVYDIDSKQPYVWNGTIWTSENTSTVTITGTTTAGYIPVFNSASQITNSLISHVDSGFAKYVNIANGNAAYALRVNGVIVADSGFEGSGGGLTNLKGENIIGSIDINKIKPVTNPEVGQIYILKSGTSTPEWTKLSAIPASSIPAAAPSLNTTSSPSTPLYVIFGGVSGGNNYYQTTGGDAFKFIPRVNGASEGAQLQIPNGSEANPSVAFSTNNNTGIYRAGFNILGISVAGKEKLRINENGAFIKSTYLGESTLKVQNSTGRPFVTLHGLNGDAQMSGTIGFSGFWNGSGGLRDLIIENFAGGAARTYPQINSHFDGAVSTATNKRRHMINLNDHGQTIIATNVGSNIDKFDNGAYSTSSPFPNGAYGCDIYNSNPSMGHGLIVRSGGGPNTVSARFDNGSKTIAYFTDKGLQIMSGSETAPSICFDSDKSQSKNTGFFLESTGKIGIVANSKKVLTISDTEIRLTKVSNLAYIFGDNTRIEGTTRTNSLEIYRPTTNGGYAICHFYSDIGGTKSAKAYIYPDGSYYRLSDRRQKENIKPLEYGLDDVLRLKPVTHTWLYGDSTKPSIGLIAQDVEEVLSEIVNTSMDGENEIKAIDYNGIIPVLIKSIQDLSKKIEILESK
jgi:hypothetical protein